MILDFPQVAHPKLSYTPGSNSTQEKLMLTKWSKMQQTFQRVSKFFLQAAIKYHGDVGEKKQTIEDRNWKVFGWNDLLVSKLNKSSKSQMFSPVSKQLTGPSLNMAQQVF